MVRTLPGPHRLENSGNPDSWRCAAGGPYLVPRISRVKMAPRRWNRP